MSPRSSYSQPDDDSTPRTGQRHPTDPNLGPDDLTAYRLKSVEREHRETRAAIQDLKDTVNATMAAIREDGVRFRETFVRHADDIKDLKGQKNKAIAGLIMGLLGAIGTLLSWILPHKG